jgi:hypothetical protein
MYDYFLGGHHNYEVDRKAADQATAIWPDMPLVMQANRAFLRRAVRFIVAQGIDQLLDIGSGIPTVGNVHEEAQLANQAARVVYVDNDPVAVAHSRALLQGATDAAIIQADFCKPDQILNHPDVARLLDLSRPLGVLVVALLHFVVDDDEAYGAVRVLRDAMPSGSYLAIQHASASGLSEEMLARIDQIYARTPTPLKLRSRDAIARFFDGLELVEPGLVYIPLWRPERPDDLFVNEPERCPGYAGIGRKP